MLKFRKHNFGYSIFKISLALKNKCYASIRPFIKRQTSGTSSDNEWHNGWQRMTTSGATSDKEWQRVVQRVTKNDNEWQRVVQQVITNNTTNDNEWQQIAMSDSEWQQWYNQWKRHSTLQRMNDCRPFNDKNRYTTTSRDGWLQLEWLNK